MSSRVSVVMVVKNKLKKNQHRPDGERDNVKKKIFVATGLNKL